VNRTLSLTVIDDDPGEADKLSRQLRTELLALDVDSADLVEDPNVPPGAKSTAGTVTAIAVSLSGSPVLVQLGKALIAWITRSQHRKIIIRDGDRSIELTGTTIEDNRKAIEGFFGPENDEE
jgi:hypothetical protein